ncbi:MAG: twin-arginine translocase TatA/TatE family subunit [Actinobacteria bacterium]|jgi:sec-independent protein translocase protein TatA|nr:twin-arginine translocase TatA/TatE family subunit [Actinomycetota bacterium]MBU1494412.1 twin-arginine translocase TatA/TatE family subunit [Actinomycetota bacterium]MBU1865310.1 twin-arginine translocase TatA/TatE family subunit [Actinomycetota bacterium]
MFRQIGTGEIILIVVVLVFLFGAKKLPELARSLGRSVKELRGGLKEGLEEGPGGGLDNELDEDT